MIMNKKNNQENNVKMTNKLVILKKTFARTDQERLVESPESSDFKN